MVVANTIVYVAIDGETSEFRGCGRDFANQADAYIAALTDGAGILERDAGGYMRVVENGKQLYSFGSFNQNDQAAKDEVVFRIGRHIKNSDCRYATLKVERDGHGKIVKIDDSDDAALIANWNSRIG